MTKELAADLPPFPLSIFFFLLSIASEPPPSPHPSCLPSSLYLFTSITVVALSTFPIATDHPLPSHHRHGHLLRPWLLFLSDPPSASLLSLSSTSDLPCSLFFLCCRSLSIGAAMAESVVLSAKSLRSPSPPYFPPMPPITAHFFYLRFLLYDAVTVILVAVALLCCSDAFPPPSSSSPSPSAPAP